MLKGIGAIGALDTLEMYTGGTSNSQQVNYEWRCHWKATRVFLFVCVCVCMCVCARVCVWIRIGLALTAL